MTRKSIPLEDIKLWCVTHGKRPSMRGETEVEKLYASQYYFYLPEAEKAEFKVWLKEHVPTLSARKSEENQVARVMSVAHILQSPTGTLEEAGRVLGITRERLRQIINKFPALHHLHAGTRRDLRDQINVETAEAIIECVRSTGISVLNACDKFEVSYNTFMYTTRMNDSINSSYSSLRKELTQGRKDKRSSEIQETLEEAKRSNKTIRAVAIAKGINLREDIYEASGRSIRKRRTPAEMQEVLESIRYLVMEKGLTKSAATSEVSFSPWDRLNLQRKVAEMYKDDTEFHTQAKTNRDTWLRGARCLRPASPKKVIPIETPARIKQAILEHRSFTEISESLSLPLSSIRRIVGELSVQEPRLAEVIKEDRAKFQKSFFERLKDRNTNLLYKGAS